MSQSSSAAQPQFCTLSVLEDCLDAVGHQLRFCGAQVGNQPLSLPEQRAHFALWALMKSPLLIGTDLVKATQQVRLSAEAGRATLIYNG